MIFAMHDPLADLLGEWSRGLNTGSVLLRIALAVLLASVIGCERSSKRHSAGLRTFVLVSFASTVSMLLDVYLMSNFGCAAAHSLGGDRHRRGARERQCHSLQLPQPDQGSHDLHGPLGVQHSRLCDRRGAVHGHGIVFLFFLCILACFPAFEQYLKNRSNHFEIHLELKNSGYLRDFVTVSRRLGLRIDDIEANQAYAGSGLSVFTVTFTICSAELKKYKTHREIIEALSSLDYIYHIEEMR